MLFNKIIKYAKLIIPALSFVALTLVFVGGFFSSNTQIEKVAAYAAEVVKNNTVNKEFCCVTAENGSGSGSIPDAETEFRNLYGSFAQRKISFASVINPDKQHSIIIGESLTENLSAMYVGPVGSTVYKDSQNIEHIKHYVYPIELMFEDDKDYEKKASSNYYAYISQSQADTILDTYFQEEKDADGHYPSESYKKLLLTIDIPFIIDNTIFNFSILNIYYETNYYYFGLAEVVGEFIMVSYSFPNNLNKERKNLYFLNDNPYQNEYYMKYINSVYNSENYIVKVNHYNIIGRINDDYLLSFHNQNSISKLDWLAVTLDSISAIILIACLGMILYIKVKFKRIDLFSLIIFVISVFIPYLLFKTINYLTGNVMFLSETSVKTNSAFVIVYIFVVLLISLVIKPLKTNTFKRSDGDYYEVTI